MLMIENIDSLSNFQRNTKAHLSKLRKSGQPAVLTVNGKAELVVQSAKAYQTLLDHVVEFKTLAAIRRGIESARSGEGRLAADFMSDLRNRRRTTKNSESVGVFYTYTATSRIRYRRGLYMAFITSSRARRPMVQ
jgi:PHD/YefM family antitoxin component YafN of YafNO toxin-antitoxin module